MAMKISYRTFLALWICGSYLMTSSTHASGVCTETSDGIKVTTKLLSSSGLMFF
jgi:hypothetical protein